MPGEYAYYEGALMLKVLRHNLEKWRQRIPHEEYGVLKAYVEMELSKLGNKADIIKTAGGIHAGTLAHETFHDIQGFLYDNYPHIMDTLHASQDEHKDVVSKWFSDKSNSEWTGPRDYKIEHFYPTFETKSPYGADLMVAAYYAVKNKLGREPSDSVFIPLGNTQWDFGRNELVPVLLSASAVGNKGASDILKVFFGECGLNQNFADGLQVVFQPDDVGWSWLS